MKGRSTRWMPWAIALACGGAFGLQACFNPQPEPPAKSGSFVPEAEPADSATGDGGGGASAGGEGGAGGSSQTPSFDHGRGPTSSVAVTSGGATSLIPNTHPKPKPRHHRDP